jgi:hypothetical protein
VHYFLSGSDLQNSQLVQILSQGDVFEDTAAQLRVEVSNIDSRSTSDVRSDFSSATVKVSYCTPEKRAAMEVTTTTTTTTIKPTATITTTTVPVVANNNGAQPALAGESDLALLASAVLCPSATIDHFGTTIAAKAYLGQVSAPGRVGARVLGVSLDACAAHCIARHSSPMENADEATGWLIVGSIIVLSYTLHWAIPAADGSHQTPTFRLTSVPLLACAHGRFVPPCTAGFSCVRSRAVRVSCAGEYVGYACDPSSGKPLRWIL